MVNNEKLGVYIYEKNLSTQEKTEKQGSRIQKAYGFDRRQKGFKEKKKQGKKEAFRINEISAAQKERRLSKAV